MKTLCLLLALLLPGSVMAEGVLTPAANPPQPVVVLSQSAIPFIKASSGTMGNNCAISGMTALHRTFSAGAYLYLPANAIEAGSAAGWYWFVASSTTAGTCYNSTYTSGTPVAGTLTAFATTGPGAFTGATGAVTAWSITLPANLMGANGRVMGNVTWGQNNSAGTKTTSLTFGGSTWHTKADTATTNVVMEISASNRGKTNSQSFTSLRITDGGTASGGTAATDGAVDTAASVTITGILNCGTATDHQYFENHQFIVYPFK